MPKFTFTFNGKSETVEMSDCFSTEQALNCRYGSADTSGVVVEMEGTRKAKKVEAKTEEPMAEADIPTLGDVA